VGRMRASVVRLREIADKHDQGRITRDGSGT
jgi:hypothetical protein